MFGHFLNEIGVRRINQVNHAVINTCIKYMRERPNPRFERIGLSEPQCPAAAVSSYFDYVRTTGNPSSEIRSTT
jgi:hypothetical protein